MSLSYMSLFLSAVAIVISIIALRHNILQTKERLKIEISISKYNKNRNSEGLDPIIFPKLALNFINIGAQSVFISHLRLVYNDHEVIINNKNYVTFAINGASMVIENHEIAPHRSLHMDFKLTKIFKENKDNKKMKIQIIVISKIGKKFKSNNIVVTPSDFLN